jgi:hypothetical protein
MLARASTSGPMPPTPFSAHAGAPGAGLSGVRLGKAPGSAAHAAPENPKRHAGEVKPVPRPECRVELLPAATSIPSRLSTLPSSLPCAKARED